MIYFDNAATTFPKPASVINAVDICNRRYCVNVGRSGYKAALNAAETVYETRKSVADFFGCENPENVIFTSNCTTAINTVLKGVLNEGDHIVCSSLEHNAVIRPLNKLNNCGVEYDVASVFAGNDEATLNAFEALIKNNTKMIITTHVSNVNGQIIPIEKLGKLAKKYGLLFAVDAAQSAGILPINMKECSIDYLFAAPHKGLYAPMGTGILIARKNIENTLIEGGTGSLSSQITQPDILPDKFESGTPNLSGIVGINRGVDFVKKKTVGAIYREEMKIIGKIYSEFRKSDYVILYTEDLKLGEYCPVLSFNIRGKSSEETAAELDKSGIAVRSGFHCAPLAHKTLGTEKSGTVRICPSVFTTFKETEIFLNAVKKLRK